MFTKYAYVYVIFGGDRYVPGVYLSAYSLKKLNTKYDIVCMVTDDVSNEAIQHLKPVVDRIIKINYLNFRATMKTVGMRKRYPNINKYFTKWNCMKLSEYEKIVYLDAATLVVKPIDHLFKNNKPAGIFLSKEKDKIITTKEIEKRFNNKTYPYKFPFVGGMIILLKPSKKLFKNYVNMMKDNSDMFMKMYKKFGSGPEELSLTYFMSYYDKGPKYEWKSLNRCYSYSHFKYIEKEKKPCPYKEIKILNVSGKSKIWENEPEEFEDIIFWHHLYNIATDNKTEFSTFKNKNYLYKDLINKLIK